MVAGLDPLTRVPSALALGPFFNVKNPIYGATGDGTTVDRTAIQSAFDAVPSTGGLVYFPPGSYLVDGSVRPKSNTTIFGDGYGSQIKCPSAGWTLVDTVNYGIINIDNKSNVTVTGLRITGTKDAAILSTPKLIYLHGVLATPSENIKIYDNDLEQSAFEGIWGGGSMTYLTNVLITGNRVKNVGHPAGAFTGLPAIQPNSNYSVISNNILEDVGSGIAASASRMVISGNLIRGITSNGIGTGDNVDNGVITIVGNTIEFTERVTGNARKGMLFNGGTGTEYLIDVSGNVVRAIGTSSIGDNICYYVETAKHVNFVGNIADIQVRGTGFHALGSTAGTIVSYKDNTVRLLSESGSSLGFRGLPNGAGQTLNLVSTGNRVYGMTRAQSSFAYHYSTSGGGTLDVKLAGDFTPEGTVSIGDVNYSSGELTLDNMFIYETNNPDISTHYLRSPKVGMLNFQSARDLAIAAGVLTISGTVASLYKRRTQITVDTESAAATDDLDTISGGQDGDLLILGSVITGRNTTIKHNTGNILCGSDFTLTSTSDRIVLIYNGGLSKWVQVGRSRSPETGWTAGTGTANKGAFATYVGQDVSAAYVEAEAQATDDAVKAVSQRLKAIEDALRTHGLIN